MNDDINEDFVRESSLGWLLAVLSNHMAGDLDQALKSRGLDLKLWPALMCLWEQEGITQTELGRMSQLADYTTTRVLDRLEKLALVERRPDPHSRRAYRIHLTEAGRELQQSLPPLAVNINQHYLTALAADERSELIRLLQKMVTGMQRD